MTKSFCFIAIALTAAVVPAPVFAMDTPPTVPGKGSSSGGHSSSGNTGGSTGGNHGSPTPIPEPGITALFALGLAGTVIARHRMRRRD